MKAEDTVMGVEKTLDKFGVTLAEDILNRDDRLRVVTEAQAEISFFAGRRDVLDLLRKTNLRAWEDLLVYIGGGII